MAFEEHPNVKLVREGYDAIVAGDVEWVDRYMSDDIVWHIGGASKWAGTTRGKAAVMELMGRQVGDDAMEIDLHDVVGGEDHVVGLGTAKATAPDGTAVEWAWVEVLHIDDGKVTERWGLTLDDSAVDPFLDSLPE